MLRALIVQAHPEAASFCAAQMRGAARTLEAQGHKVEISDLYAQGWNAGSGRGNFMHAQGGPFKPQAEQVRAAQNHTFAPDVAAEPNKLLAADLLIFSFPMWFSLPALLKGWVDRVFVMGAVYGSGVGTYDNGKFLGRRALLCTTGGPESAYGPQTNNGELNTALFHIHNGMLRFAGYTVLAPVVGYGPARVGDERAAQLGRVREAFTGLDDRAKVFG